MLEIEIYMPGEHGVYSMWVKCPDCGVRTQTFYNIKYPDAWYGNKCKICNAIIPNAKAMFSFGGVRLSYHRDTILKLNSVDQVIHHGAFGDNAVISRGAL